MAIVSMQTLEEQSDRVKVHGDAQLTEASYRACFSHFCQTHLKRYI